MDSSQAVSTAIWGLASPCLPWFSSLHGSASRNDLYRTTHLNMPTYDYLDRRCRRSVSERVQEYLNVVPKETGIMAP